MYREQDKTRKQGRDEFEIAGLNCGILHGIQLSRRVNTDIDRNTLVLLVIVMAGSAEEGDELVDAEAHVLELVAGERCGRERALLLLQLNATKPSDQPHDHA